MSNKDRGRRFDLEERTAKFGEAIIAYARTLPCDPVTSSLITQLARSSTSIGANYREADDSGSRKEFRYRIGICKREARENKYWLRMIAAAVPQSKNSARLLWTEAKELHLIFAAIFLKLRE